jgi:hypothetical protein
MSRWNTNQSIVYRRRDLAMPIIRQYRAIRNRSLSGRAMSKAREFVDFWIENSVHAREQFSTPGASQDVAELTRRCIEAARGQGVSEADLQGEIGDVADYIRGKLGAANEAESDQHRPGN